MNYIKIKEDSEIHNVKSYLIDNDIDDWTKTWRFSL